MKHHTAARAKSGAGVEGGGGWAGLEVKEGVIVCLRRLTGCTPRTDAGGRDRGVREKEMRESDANETQPYNSWKINRTARIYAIVVLQCSTVFLIVNRDAQ